MIESRYQRARGSVEQGSFAYAIDQLREYRWQHATNDDEVIPLIDAVQEAHDREIERGKCRIARRTDAFRCMGCGVLFPWPVEICRDPNFCPNCGWEVER